MITDNNAKPGSNTQAQPQAQTASASPTRGGSLAALSSRFHMGNSRGRQANVAKNLCDAFVELINSSTYDQSNGEIFINLLDNKVHRVALSGITFSMRDGDLIIASTILFEGSEVAHIKPIRSEYAGETREIPRPATNLYDQTTTMAVREILEKEYSNEKVTVIDVGANIVYTEVSSNRTVEELVKSEAVQAILFYAINNLMTKQIELTHDKDRIFNTAWATTDKNTRIRANIDKNPAPLFNANGLPVRADLQIDLSASSNDNSNSSKFDEASGLTTAAGYMDLTYVEARDAAALQSQLTNGYVDPNSITQSYIPRFVITSLNAYYLDLVTPELTLLALASTVVLSTGNGWISMFAPKYGRHNGADLTDVGAIGFEAVQLTDTRTPARIDVKSDDFASNPGNLVDFITTAMFQTINYSQDIVECSDTGSIDSMFLAAATGNQDARAAIFAHCDALTNNRFSTRYPDGPIAFYNNVIVPMGYYDDKDGNRKDLRDWDYLAMLNTHGDKDINIVERFANTYDKTDVAPYHRLSVLKDILTNTIGASVVVKAIAHRIDWDPEFLIALQLSIIDNGFVVESNGLGAYSSNANRRGNSNALQRGVRGNGINTFFSSGNSNYGNFANAQQYSRWNRPL